MLEVHPRSTPLKFPCCGNHADPLPSKHRVFVWMSTDVVPDHKLHVIASEDDYVFGILQSRMHEKWTLAQCSWLGVGNDPSYSSSRTFGTFPFPWSPGKQPRTDSRQKRIATAARKLLTKRNAWLKPPKTSAEESKNRTLTKLYNENPTWLKDAHRELDEAVFAAYGWPNDLSDEAILARLLNLNMARFAEEQARRAPGEPAKATPGAAPKKLPAAAAQGRQQSGRKRSARL